VCYYFTDESITYYTNISAKLSTTHLNCDASKAFDGNVLYKAAANDTILCQACSVATDNGTPWLQLDLRTRYLINSLRLFGRGTYFCFFVNGMKYCYGNYHGFSEFMQQPQTLFVYDYIIWVTKLYVCKQSVSVWKYRKV